MDLAMRMRDKVMDLLFPQVRCMVCGRAEGVKGGICASCRSKTEKYPLEDACEVCGRAQGARGICLLCREKAPAYTAARAVFVYESAVRTLVHLMKFRGQYDLPVRFFAQEMSDALDQLGWEVDCVVAVPTTGKSLRKRGYNQAEKLAKRLCRLRGLRFVRQVIRKKRGTRSQVGLNSQQRRENLLGSVLPGRKSGCVHGKRVLLIDDVYTTGSTAEVCAQVLKACGVEAVYVLCIARVAEKALEQYLAGKME